jgi:hypothetical protein
LVVEPLASDLDVSGWPVVSGECVAGHSNVVHVPHGRWRLHYEGLEIIALPNTSYCDSKIVTVGSGQHVTWAPQTKDGTKCGAPGPNLHCPILVIEGRAVRAVLVDRSAPSLAGEDRVPLSSLAVRDGVVEMEIAERVPETSYVEHVVLDVDGRAVAPQGPASFTLDLGERASLRFDVGGADRRIDATLIVAGWYARYL